MNLPSEGSDAALDAGADITTLMTIGHGYTLTKASVTSPTNMKQLAQWTASTWHNHDQLLEVNGGQLPVGRANQDLDTRLASSSRRIDSLA